MTFHQQSNNWKFDQPDPIYEQEIFEPYTRNGQTRQTRQSFPLKTNSAPYNNVFQSQNPINTQSSTNSNAK